ncbi:hypothetical protein G7B40_001680 [Aetokthonos hydrillicola Thurmond2011]|uniref:Uncharacterized protein n=2 Tax=Aetokthonos TaxID=1550243 RepID=A0AAP5M734_9CYAN|nr:hypothetical protein [Aetokthonos hydrillicola CCALA 1050]MBW4591263.1 hypothetical protein [Aetokthonos hydrillicola CCALA 1050]MDR9893297.1 hypothetical protein [Aetokthonos hydrillicola Thurmond2011]
MITDLITETTVNSGVIRQYIARLLQVGEVVPIKLISSLLESIESLEEINKFLKKEISPSIEIHFTESERLKQLIDQQINCKNDDRLS